MAKLYFSYAAMNAGKSTILLQASYNYRERGMHTLMFTSSLYAETDDGQITSRIGIAEDAELYSATDDLFARIEALHAGIPVACVFIDEAQFLTPDQVWQLARVVDRLNIPVLCYGLRTDFRGDLFPDRPPCSRSRTRCAKCAPSAIAAARPRWWCARTSAAKLSPKAIRSRSKKRSTPRSAGATGKKRWAVGRSRKQPSRCASGLRLA